METIFRSLPPAGSSLGIAFSGGLDTRAAVAWLSAAGMRVHAYTANLAQPDEKNISEIPGIAKRHGASAARLIDCRESLVHEGLIAIQCGAFHLSTAGKKYFNTTPLGRAVTTTAIIRVMKEEGVDIFGDGSTYKGNDIQRFYRYGLLVNPELRIYKPWLDDKFVGQFGGRNEMAEYLTSRNLPYPVATEKAYSTDANLLGATHEAKDLEYLDRSMEVVTPIMGIPFWDQSIKVEPERVLIEFQKGLPVALNGKGFDADFELFRAANEIGGRHGLGMSDQIENRVIEAKSRGIYEAPGMALLHIAYERLLSAIHNENTLKLYFTLGYELGRLLYDGRWYDPEANLIKDSLIRWVASAVSGSVELQLRRGDDYSILNTKAECPAYDPEKLSMESKATDFQPGDRIGALEIMQMGISDNRRLLLHYVDKALADKSQSEIEAIKRILSL